MEYLDKETPGALIGKAVKYIGEKFIVYGDIRLVEYRTCCPLLIGSDKEEKVYSVSLGSISPWIEPKPESPIVERAQAMFKSSNNDYISDALFTKEQAYKYAENYNLKLLKYPVGTVYKFRDGELVE